MSHAHNPYTAVSRSLPILRGWAIVWIVMYHLLGNTKGYVVLPEILPSLFQGNLKLILESSLQLLISAGDTGVSIFLVISGFGLTASWWKQYGCQGIKSIALVKFWSKRVFKIFPLFWAAVVISTALYLINSDWAPFGQGIWEQKTLTILGAFLATITTVRNVIPDYYYFLNGAWWYIGLALQLYLIFPVLIRLGQRWGWSNLLMASFLLSGVYRAVFALAPLDDMWTVMTFDLFPARLFEFTFGIYIAITFLGSSDNLVQNYSTSNSTGERWLRSLLFKPQFLGLNLCCFLVGLLFKWSDYEILSIFEDALISVGLFCTLIFCAQFKGLTLGPLIKTAGKYSYGIYLTHMNIYLVLWPMASKLVPSYWPRFVIVMLACCAIGASFETGYGWLQKQLQNPKVA
ncbi:MAG: acyltransferase [Cyanobacteria bacterium P01_B01_bin.77]